MSYKFLWSGPKSGAPIVSIATYGITFNSSVIELLEKPAKILMGYDAKKNVIGIKPLEDDDPSPQAFTFAERDKKGYVRIGNKDFIKYISAKSGINMSSGKRYPAEWDEEEEVLIIDLKSPIDETFDIESDNVEENEQ